MTMTATAQKDEHVLTLQHYFARAGVLEDQEYARHIQMGLVPEPHQVTGLRNALASPNNRYGLFDETGTMKTLQMQAFALYYAGYGNKVVIIMPPTLFDQFCESFRSTFIGMDNYFTLHVLTEGPAPREKLFAKWRQTEWPDLMIMSYQQFGKLPRERFVKKNDLTFASMREAQDWIRSNQQQGEKLIASNTQKGWVVRRKVEANPDDYIARVLKMAGYNVVVADEAHALKSTSSNVHKAVKYLLGNEGDSALLLATGTPAHNTLLDTYALIKLITPRTYHSKASFERLHCVYTQEGEWSRLIGFQNKDVLARNLFAQARRVTKEQVMTLEEPHVIELPISLHSPHKSLYRKLVRERFLEKGDELINAVTQQALRQKCLQIVTTPERFTNDKFKNAVFETVDELLDEIGHEKIILFAHFQESILALRKYYEAKGLRPVTVYGGQGNNAKSVKQFLTDDKCRMMIAHPKSGGVGLNLQGVCRYAVFVEPTGVPGDFKQASDRIHRKGQKKAVTIYVFKVIGTVGPTLTRNMLQKEAHTLSVTRDKHSLMSELLGESA